MLIEQAQLQKDCLQGQVILLTGAGGGIGLEAARALAWMGAAVIIAEIDEEKGRKAEQAINDQLNRTAARFFPVDLAEEAQIGQLYSRLKKEYGFIDVVFNNATIAPLGAVDGVPISDWDKSYAVNLRAPVLLTQAFLPDMKARNRGTIVFVPSSGAAPYMGAYEIFKTAQVELCNTLIGELEQTNIHVYSIGPGLVKTETAQKAIERTARLMNLSTEEFYAMNERHILEVEHAGVGFALSVAYAEKYHGQEISSIQALIDAGLLGREEEPAKGAGQINLSALKPHLEAVTRVFHEQYDGWLARNVFERQWVLRDFKKQVNLSAEQFKYEISQAQELMEREDLAALAQTKNLFVRLQEYYRHQQTMLQSYEKDLNKRRENTRIIQEWMDELQAVIDAL